MSQRVYDAAAREKLTKWLGGEKKDFKAATDLLVSENREVTLSFPDPIFGELSLIELAIIHNQVAFFKAATMFTKGRRVKPCNAFEYSFEYLSLLYNFNGGKFKDLLQKLVYVPPKGYKMEGEEVMLESRKPNPLLQACAAGHVNVFNHLIKENPNSINNYAGPEYLFYAEQRTALETAALHNQRDMFERILKVKEFNVHSHISPLGDALRIAARMGHAEIMQVILATPALTANLNVPDPAGYTALGLAVLNGHTLVVEMLLNALVKTSQGKLAQSILQLALSRVAQLREAIFSKDTSRAGDIVLLLIEHGASQEGLSNEQREFIEVLKQRTKQSALPRQNATAEMLTNLPYDIWDAILLKIEVPSLKVLSRASKWFRDLSESYVWRDVRLKITEEWLKRQNKEIFAAVINKLKFVHSLTISCKSYVIDENERIQKMFADISKHCVNLHELDLKEYQRHVTIPFLDGLYKNCPQLRSLKFGALVPKNYSPEEGFKEHSKAVDLTQGLAQDVAASTQSLQHLSMTIALSHKKATAENYVEFLRSVLAKSPNLKSLTLLNIATQVKGFRAKLLLDVVLPLFDTNKNLKELHMAGYWALNLENKEEYQKVFAKFGTLNELELCFKKSGTDEDLDLEPDSLTILGNIRQHCTGLSALRLEISGAGLTAEQCSLAALTNLKRVEISFFKMGPVAQNWQELTAHSGHKYYYNADTKQTQWNKPAGMGNQQSGVIQKFVNNLTASATNLEELRVIFENPQPNFDLICLSPALKSFFYSLEIDSVAPFIPVKNTLRELFLGTLAVRDLQVLVDSCSALTSLHVGVGTGEVVDVGEILSKLPNLESLVLKGTFNDQSFQVPAMCLNLKTLLLKATGSHIMTDLPMFYLSEACPNLEHLEYNFGVSYDLQPLLQTRLQKLHTVVNRDKTPVMKNILHLANQTRAVKIKKGSD